MGQYQPISVRVIGVSNDHVCPKAEGTFTCKSYKEGKMLSKTTFPKKNIILNNFWFLIWKIEEIWIEHEKMKFNHLIILVKLADCSSKSSEAWLHIAIKGQQKSNLIFNW